MKYSILIFTLFFYLSAYSQTCIIAKKTKEAIYVGADSRGMTPYYNPITKATTYSPTSLLCKIQSSGKFNFTVCGIGFPIAMEECKKACLGKKSFDKVIREYIPAFGKRLQDTLEKLRNEKFTAFIDILKDIPEDSNRLGRTIFFGVESDTLYLAQVDFYLLTKMNEKVQISASGGTGTLFGGGHLNEIKDTILKESTWKTGAVKTLNSLIKIEMNYHTLEVGGDIDIIKVTTKGTMWIQRKKICN